MPTDPDGLSPYERAEREGRLDDFTKFTDELYKRDPTGNAATGAGVNLYDPTTYGNLPGGPVGGGSKQSVSGVPQDWLDDFLKRNPGDIGRAASAYGSNNMSKTNTPGGGSGSQSVNVPGQFTDPIGSYLEQFAQKRAQDRENPPAGSGQALLEQALRNISGQFSQGGFTPGEMEIFQTQAIDPLEKLRTARKQQVMQQLSARGIDPRSGVGISMIQDVDRQFDAQRATQQRSIAGQAAQERQSRMLQSLELLSGLAGTENSRLNEAFQYRQYPMNLADRAFNQAMQVYNLGGNPLAMAGPLSGLAGMQQGRSDASMENLATLLWYLTQGRMN